MSFLNVRRSLVYMFLSDKNESGPSVEKSMPGERNDNVILWN